jgi:hypothetical protein
MPTGFFILVNSLRLKSRNNSDLENAPALALSSSGNSSTVILFRAAVLVLTKISVTIESASSPNPARLIQAPHFARYSADAPAGAFGGGSTFVVESSTLLPGAACLTPFLHDQ